MEQYDGAGVDPGQELIQGLFPGGLIVLDPVYMGQAPEEGVIAKLLSHFQVVGTVFSLGRTVISGQRLSGDLPESLFHVLQFFLEGFLSGDL